MNIPMKYEDVVAQLETERARVTDYIAQRAQTELKLEAALGREAALREELAAAKRPVSARRDFDYDRGFSAGSAEVETFRLERDALQQRLTVAEQRAGELEGLLHMSKELLTTISRHGATTKPNDWCDSFKAEVAERIEKIGAALKPAAEVPGSTCNQIREESGLSTTNPCVACNNGACIDR